jgi:hypothetical protein
LLDRTVGVHNHQRARQQPESLDLAWTSEHELNQLGEEADLRLLPRCGIPALEDADQPARVPAARRGAAPVRVRQQQVKRRRGELEQRFVGAHRLILNVDRAQDAAVALLEFRREQQVKAGRDGVEAVAAADVAPVPPGRLGVSVQADAYADSQAPQRGQHRPVEQGPVGLDAHVHLGGHARTEQADEGRQPLRPGEQRLTAMQDDVDAGEGVLLHVLGDALDGPVGHGGTHSLRQPAPALIRHLVDVTI